MSLTNKVAQFDADSDLVNAWVHGGPTTSITTDSGTVASPAKLIADQNAVINIGAASVLSLSTAQASVATTQAGIATTQAGLATINGAAQVTLATAQKDLAVVAKTAAELAAVNALISADSYVDEATGRAAVADGVAFKVQGSGDVAAYEYRKINSSTPSTLIATYPSSAKVDGIMSDLDDAGLRIYTGSGPFYPIATDSNGRMVLWYDSINQRIEGDDLRGVNQANTTHYTGSASVYPIMTDNTFRVLLGYDALTQELVGAFPPFPEIPDASPIASLNKVALSDPPIAKAVNHLLFYGQSLSVGSRGTPVLSATQPYSNITFQGGPRAWNGTALTFLPPKPLVEDAVSPSHDGSTNRGETACSGAANYALTLAALENGLTPASHVILASTAGRGGTAISGLNKASGWYTTNFLPHITNGKAVNTNYALHAFAWLQGEQDITDLTSYATYRAALEQLQADIEADAQAISGQISPVYCLTYQVSWSITTHSDVALAQLDLAKTNPKFALVTPCYHLAYAADAVHLSAVGYKWIGAYFGRAYKQLVIDGVKPQWLNPLSATRRGAVIRVRFSVPQLPLVLDTTTLALTLNHGFKLLDGATPATISSIQISGNDVVITLGAVPTGEVTVRYALDYLGTGLTVTAGASGNLRDSTTDVITINAVDYPLYHVSPHFQMIATTLQE